MKNAITLSCLSLIFITSCNSTKNFLHENLAGNYQGIIPCADCEGIKTNLTIKDNTFEKTSIYLGKEANLFKTQGNWESVNDSTILLKENNEKSFYKVSDDKLIVLDQNQNLIENPYLLYKTEYNNEAEGDFSSKIKEGIDFFAGGNEPFWSIEIKAGKFLKYNKPDFEKPELITDFTVEHRENTIIVKPVNHQKIKEIRVYNFPCVNDMSGMVSEKYTELHLETGVLKGCGKMLGDKLSLNGEWKLNHIKNSDLKNYKNEKRPNIIFDLNENRISGFLGCNGFGGNILFSDSTANSIAFKQIFSTQMACPDLDTENNYSSLLQQVDNFKIVNNELQLLKADDLLLSFEK